MNIQELIVNLMELAKRSNMTFEEMMAWISRNDRDENTLPWEE